MRLSWLGAGALFVTSVLAGSGCQSAPSATDTARTATQAIQGGTVDTASSYRFAVGVCNGSGPINSGNCVGICSGALILPNVVATARHCVDGTPAQIDCSANETFGARQGTSFRITTNTTMAAAASGWYGVKSIVVPDDDHICGNDIALLVLNSSVPSAVAKPITPGVQYLMWDHDRYEPAFIGIGYGNTSPAGETFGTRRISLPISVLCVPGSDDRPCPASINVNPKDFVGGDGLCQGDSGSSAFEAALLEDGTPLSFGVLSRGGSNAAGTKCVGSIYTRFDAHRDFVLAAAKAASNDWTLYPEPPWTAYEPPYQPKKDAGATSAPDAKALPKPPGLAVGEACETAEQCSSGVCTDAGDATLICSDACEDGSTCPEGWECRESLCLPPLAAAPPAAAPATVKTTTTCAASPAPAMSWGWLFVGAAAVLAAARRRKR